MTIDKIPENTMELKETMEPIFNSMASILIVNIVAIFRSGEFDKGIKVITSMLNAAKALDEAYEFTKNKQQDDQVFISKSNETIN